MIKSLRLLFEEFVLILSIILNFISSLVGTAIISATLLAFFVKKFALELGVESIFEKIGLLILVAVIVTPTIVSVAKLIGAVKQYRELTTLETEDWRSYMYFLFSIVHTICVPTLIVLGIMFAKNPENETIKTAGGIVFMIGLFYTIAVFSNSK